MSLTFEGDQEDGTHRRRLAAQDISNVLSKEEITRGVRERKKSRPGTRIDRHTGVKTTAQPSDSPDSSETGKTAPTGYMGPCTRGVGQKQNIFEDTPPVVKKSKMLWKEILDSAAVIMAQTADFDALSRLPFWGTMLDSVGATEAMSKETSAYHAWVAVQRVVDAIPPGSEVTESYLNVAALRALEEYRVGLGVALMDNIDGSHFTFVNPSAQSSPDIVSEALRLLYRFSEKGVPSEQIIISIPATEPGVEAAKRLAAARIYTNLTHVSSLIHAAICVEAGASVITFCCEPMLVAHKVLYNTQMDQVRPRDHACIQAIQATVEYFKVNKIQTQILVNSFCGTPTMEPLKGLNCIALRETEINEVMERGVPFTAPPADSVPCLRAQQAQYPTRYMSSRGGYLSAMSAATRSMATMTLIEGIRDMEAAWQRMLTVFRKDIRSMIFARDSSAEKLTRPYKEDLRTAQMLIEEYRMDVPQAYKMTAMRGREMPRVNDLGFRMCTITWGYPVINYDHGAVAEGAIVAANNPIPTETYHMAGSSMVSNDDKIDIPPASEPRRNIENPVPSELLNSTSSIVANKNGKQYQEYDVQDEVF